VPVGIVPENGTTFHATQHDMVEVTRKIDTRLSWHTLESRQRKIYSRLRVPPIYRDTEDRPPSPFYR